MATVPAVPEPSKAGPGPTSTGPSTSASPCWFTSARAAPASGTQRGTAAYARGAAGRWTRTSSSPGMISSASTTLSCDTGRSSGNARTVGQHVGGRQADGGAVGEPEIEKDGRRQQGEKGCAPPRTREDDGSQRQRERGPEERVVPGIVQRRDVLRLLRELGPYFERCVGRQQDGSDGARRRRRAQNDGKSPARFFAEVIESRGGRERRPHHPDAEILLRVAQHGEQGHGTAEQRLRPAGGPRRPPEPEGSPG